MLIKKSTSGYLDKDGNLHKTKRQEILANEAKQAETMELLEELD